MFFAIIFVCTRISQITTLIPVMGMLAWFINVFVANNALTPDSILILFITSVLALAWAVFTLFSYHRSSANALFVAVIDMAIFGTLIAAVYQLRGIDGADCTDGTSLSRVWTARVVVPDLGWSVVKPCAMLKACWAFSIMNVVFFFTTAVAAFNHGGRFVVDDGRLRAPSTTYHHSSRHSHRHRSHSGGSRHGTNRSPHSHSRRVYV
ncbi:Uncharacterized protein TCAP_00417 [Tolypocladium capitatum]|uniref:MARVEL domain-containing protein n=1 Tax=Tolypocladium capitatum TaxID=45235 RepID=A0A2K3QQ51_9HYPO|nr:Uncharacterized protein TCAP_00417 [Tolypocladium capitatum]